MGWFGVARMVVMNRPKNLLMIEANTDGTIGGSHYCLLEIVQRIDREKYSPMVLFFERNVLESEFRDLCPVGFAPWVRRADFRAVLPNWLGGVPLLRAMLAVAQKVSNLFFVFIPGFARILSFIVRNRIDIVHINNAPYLSDWLLACKLLGVKCTAHLRGNWVPGPGPLRRALIKHYDSVVGVSRSVVAVLEAQGIRTENFRVIHDGIDPELKVSALTDSAWEEIVGRCGGRHVIGVVGNIKPWKGQDVLIRALDTVRRSVGDVKCLVVGDVGRMQEDQEYFARLVELVNRLGLEEHVIFLGFRRDVLALVSRLSVLVHTSTDPEPLGRVILEGMLMGKPVVATAHGGPLEIIEEGRSGFLVPANDPAALAEKLVGLMENDGLRAQVGERARLRVREGFNLEDKVLEFEAFLEEACGNRP
jgi:glycosyltransferase involved in cell wall biosynthesis